MALIPKKTDGATTTPVKTITPKAAPAAAAAPVADAPAAAPAEAPAPAPAQTTAVAAAPATGAVSAVVARPIRNAIEENFLRKLDLEWNTLPRIQANQGNFLDLERNKEAFGNEIVVQLMSYQPSWQLSPGTDNPSDIEYVRYSNDGVTATNGDNLQEHLQALKAANYDKAKINSRYMMAFVILEAPSDKTGLMKNKLVQIDVSESSKKSFDQFMMQNGFNESRGIVTPEVAASGILRLSATVKSNKGFSWTVVGFANAG